MAEKRYFKRMWGDEFYIFDSQTISEKDFDEKVEYEDYRAFADSLMGDEVVDRLNELDSRNKRLEEKIQRERTSFTKTHERWSKEAETKIKELSEENEQLKSDNFNLNKTVECLDKTVKEQCNKIDWADECGVRWEEEYNKWIGGNND